MTYPATPEAARLLTFMQAYAAKHAGASPSHDEMKDALGLKSKSGVNRMLVQLEERGLIRRLPYRARCIEIVQGQSVTLPRSVYRLASAAARAEGRSTDDYVADVLLCFLRH